MSDEGSAGIKPLFSILCATVTSRAPVFAKLHAELKRQSEGKPVEIVVACDNKEISIGRKRQNMLIEAQGEYVAHVDDDDWIAPDYVDSILSALETKPDCVGFEIECTFDGQRKAKAVTSAKYKRWGQNQDGYAFTRSPYHKTVIRRELALKAGFPDMRYGEDQIFSRKVTLLIKTEEFVKKTLYYYRFSSAEPFMLKYGITKNNRDQHKIIRDHVRKPFQH